MKKHPNTHVFLLQLVNPLCDLFTFTQIQHNIGNKIFDAGRMWPAAREKQVPHPGLAGWRSDFQMGYAKVLQAAHEFFKVSPQ